MSLIELRQVSLEFPVYGMQATSLKKELIRLTTGGVFGRSAKHDIVTIKALKNINLRLEKGDKLGLIGHNGAGKSTLLRVLAKIYEPTGGAVIIRGAVSALLDVMMGMNGELTGYENIMLRGVLHGLTLRQIKSIQAEIAEFTELGGYLVMPVRTYSAGMALRLAFGVATSMTAEILVLDEVMDVGDAGFQQKSTARIEAMIQDSHIVIMASHDIDILSKNCNRLLVLEAGEIAFLGDIDQGLKWYEYKMGICAHAV